MLSVGPPASAGTSCFGLPLSGEVEGVCVAGAGSCDSAGIAVETSARQVTASHSTKVLTREEICSLQSLNMMNRQRPCASIDAQIRNWDVFARSQTVPLVGATSRSWSGSKHFGPIQVHFRGFTMRKVLLAVL